MEKVTGLALPWRMLRQKLAAVDKETGLVQYMTTFQEDGTKKEVSSK